MRVSDLDAECLGCAGALTQGIDRGRARVELISPDALRVEDQRTELSMGVANHCPVRGIAAVHIPWQQLPTDTGGDVLGHFAAAGPADVRAVIGAVYLHLDSGGTALASRISDIDDEALNDCRALG
ncbi:hypothetical protein D3C80_1874950 [compost metagenome]